VLDANNNVSARLVVVIVPPSSFRRSSFRDRRRQIDLLALVVRFDHGSTSAAGCRDCLDWRRNPGAKAMKGIFWIRLPSAEASALAMRIQSCQNCREAANRYQELTPSPESDSSPAKDLTVFATSVLWTSWFPGA